MKKLSFIFGLCFSTTVVFAQVEVSPAPKALKSNSEISPANQEIKTNLGEFERIETRNPDGSVTVNMVKKGSVKPVPTVADQIKAIDDVINAIEQKWKHIAADLITDKEAKSTGWYTKQEAELKKLRAEKENLTK